MKWLIILVIAVVDAIKFPQLGALFGTGEKNSERELLPKLLPHKEKDYIIEFVSDGSDACDQMEPVVKRLEEDLGIKVRKINISRRQEYGQLFEVCGGNECGNLPFFYNRRTAQAICGATP